MCIYGYVELLPPLTIQGPPHALTVIHPPRLSGSLLLSLTCCSPPSLLCGRNSGRLWGRSRGTTNIVMPQVILTFGLGQSNVNLLCVYMGMWNYFPPNPNSLRRRWFETPAFVRYNHSMRALWAGSVLAIRSRSVVARVESHFLCT